jgi:lipopolysaccharide biosynthesis glycosyltransferase
MITATQGRATEMIPVVFCADVNVLDCLAVAVASVLGNASRPVRIHVFHDGMPVAAQRFLQATVSPACREGGETTFEQLDVSSFRGHASLHGNWMTYARLLLHSAMPTVDRAIYLDADITVHRDITELWETPLNGRPLAGAAHCLKDAAIEQDVWRALAIDPATPYYNAGVLVLDLARWRASGVDARFAEYFQKTRGLKTVVDQTALNVVFGNQWADLPRAWNTACWPDGRLAEGCSYALLHYVGSPKPWDVAGRWLHSESELFFATADRWGVDLRAARRLMPFGQRLRRAALLARSYAKAMRRKLHR